MIALAIDRYEVRRAADLHDLHVALERTIGGVKR
jgi:hypothetical protein